MEPKVNIESLHIFYCEANGKYYCTAKIGSDERNVEFKLTDAETRALLLPLADVIAEATSRYSGIIAADIVSALEKPDEDLRIRNYAAAKAAQAIIEQGNALSAPGQATGITVDQEPCDAKRTMEASK